MRQGALAAFLALAACQGQGELNIEEMGNTSSASVPLTLDQANRAGRLKDGDLVLMMAIGGGMAWGSALVKW